MHPAIHCREQSIGFVSLQAKWPKIHSLSCKLLANRPDLKRSIIITSIFSHIVLQNQNALMRPKPLLLGYPKYSARTGLGRTRHIPRKRLKWKKRPRIVKEEQQVAKKWKPHTCSTHSNCSRQGKRKQPWSLVYFKFCTALLQAAAACRRERHMRAGGNARAASSISGLWPLCEQELW